MKCPQCDTLISNDATHCLCGWKAPETTRKGPDYARIEADRQRSIDEAFKPRKGPRACQSTLCPPNSRALPGRDLCKPCAALEDAGSTVPRIRRSGIKRIDKMLEPWRI